MLMKLLIFLVFCFVVSYGWQEIQAMNQIQAMNPVARFRVRSNFKKKLAYLNVAAQKREDEERTRTERYRNCFFSPIQCQVPVRVEKDPLLNAILSRSSAIDTSAYLRK
ncbi:unnamed protein product, partial [Mesorhabditis belari]|uniref:Uncharacterized protein n=1 Tax=Mesorhabditis belari TaxID=2138241 RepID=A0AAF3ECD5_9BILA